MFSPDIVSSGVPGDEGVAYGETLVRMYASLCAIVRISSEVQ